MTSKAVILLVVVLFATLFLASAHDDHHEDEYITCASTVKIFHKSSGYHLHSSQVSWGSGSSELAVTAVPPASSNPNALWQFITSFNPQAPEQHCAFGDVIKCGDIVRLKHSATQTHLRSQLHKAPLSSNQEVSSENRGDKSFENFQLQCVGVENGTQMTKLTEFKLKHQRTNKFLSTRIQDQFNQQNCRGCPILNHLEIHCKAGDDVANIFTIGDGYYVPINTERIVYDYTDLSPQVKVISSANAKSDATKNEKKGKHDEL